MLFVLWTLPTKMASFVQENASSINAAGGLRLHAALCRLGTICALSLLNGVLFEGTVQEVPPWS